MFFEILIVLFEHPSVFATDIALVFLIIVHLIPLRSELCEGVDHNTTDNVSEEEPKENKVN